MRVTPATFNGVAIALGVVVVMLLPFWHFGTWGFTPSVVVAALLALLFALRVIARD